MYIELGFLVTLWRMEIVSHLSRYTKVIFIQFKKRNPWIECSNISFLEMVQPDSLIMAKLEMAKMANEKSFWHLKFPQQCLPCGDRTFWNFTWHKTIIKKVHHPLSPFSRCLLKAYQHQCGYEGITEVLAQHPKTTQEPCAAPSAKGRQGRPGNQPER